MTHVVAIGGSDAGIAAALRIRELDPSVETTVVLDDEFPNYSICGIPYWLSGDVVTRDALAHRTRRDLEAAGINLLTSTRVEHIDPAGRQLVVRTESRQTRTLAYDDAIIGTGATPVVPSEVRLDPDEGIHRLHTIADAQAVMDSLERASPRAAVIVGAGYIGLEMVEALRSRGIEVTLLQRSNQVLPTLDPELAELVAAEVRSHGAGVRTGITVTGVAAGDGAHRWTVHGRATGDAADPGTVAVGADLVLMCTGVRPSVDLAVAAGARTGVSGAIVVDTHMRTGVPHLWAAGDCVVTHHRILGHAWLPLGTTAHKQGRVAGENAIGGDREFAGTLGTQVVKVFDLVAARTGLRDHEARTVDGLDPLTVRARADDHKAYYPGATPLDLAVTADRNSEQLLGAQIVGRRNAEVAKRIDTFATAIHADLTVDAVSDLDLSYTPPLGSPWDAIQVAAQAWAREAARGDR